MKYLLLAAGLLAAAPAAFAQTACAALQQENTALKDQVAAYEARLGIGAGGARVEDGDATLKIKVVSCKASRASHRAVLTFLVTNTGAPQNLQIQSLATQDQPSQVIDETGKAYTSTSSYYPTLGANQLKASVPTNVPLSGTLTFLDVPATTKQLSAAVLSFQKLRADMTGAGKPEEYFKTRLLAVPVTWVP